MPPVFSLKEVTIRLSKKILRKLILIAPDKLVNKVLPLVPSSQRSYLSHEIARLKFYKYMNCRIGDFLVKVDAGPAGPKEFIMQTAVLNQDDVPKKVSQDFYFESGYTQMLKLIQIAERFSFNLRTAEAILELGSGTARLIRHLRCLDGIRLVGSDLSKDMIAWCQRNVPGVEFYVNNPYPPLPFADEESFDLVFAASVFTHIPPETQHLWIKELYRVLRPGGLLLCDVLGRYHQQRMLGSEDLQCLRKEGKLILSSADSNASLSTRIIGSWDVFQTRGQVLRVFGSVFRVLDYLPFGINLVVLQKPQRWQNFC